MKSSDLRKALFESLENTSKDGLNVLSIMDSINGINKILSTTRRFVSPELNEDLMTFMKEVSKKVDPVQKAMMELEKSTKRGALSIASGEKVLTMSLSESDESLGDEEKALVKAGRELLDHVKTFSSLEPKFESYFANFERFLGASDHFRGQMNKQIDLMMNLVIGPSAID
jgi:hypothetical protein